MYSSDRIYLRPLNEDDITDILEMRSDIEGVKAAGGLPFPSGENSIKNWINNLYPKDNLTSITLVIAETDTGNFIGYCSALNISYLNRHAHVGFIFHKKGQGKGYFRESQILFYAYLFREINLRKVYSYALQYNEIAIKVDKKIGFKEEGIMKEHIYQGGKYHDAIMLSLMSEDFFIRHNVDEIIK